MIHKLYSITLHTGEHRYTATLERAVELSCEESEATARSVEVWAHEVQGIFAGADDLCDLLNFVSGLDVPAESSLSGTGKVTTRLLARVMGRTVNWRPGPSVTVEVPRELAE